MQQQQTVQATKFNEVGVAAAGLTEKTLTNISLTGSAVAGVERKRVETVVETLANLRGEGESLAEVAHDARNMVTALGLYCDLLEEPGVLTPAFRHYGNELRLVATASRRLVEKLLALDVRLGPAAGLIRTSGPLPVRKVTGALSASRQDRTRRWDLMPAEPIENLAGELLANRNLLSALAGPAITLTVDVEGGAQPVRLTGEDLTRILVNLIKNASEAMPDGGSIQIKLREQALQAAAQNSAPFHPVQGLLLTIEDNGPGISVKALDKIFESGYTTRSTGAFRHGGWPASHRGLGLSITRSMIEAAGGSIRAANRIPNGASFQIELPVRSR
jgi:signal transduction histidine kinase